MVGLHDAMKRTISCIPPDTHSSAARKAAKGDGHGPRETLLDYWS